MSTNGDEETNTTEVKTKAPKPAAKSRAKAVAAPAPDAAINDRPKRERKPVRFFPV
jgi:hypothetical protein